MLPLTKAFMRLPAWRQAAETRDLPVPAGSRRVPQLTAVLCLVSIVGVSAGVTEVNAAARHRETSVAPPLASDLGPDRPDVLAGLTPVAAPPQLAQADFVGNARRAYRRRDYKTALKLWTLLAKKGNPEAQDMLGVMHENGEGVPLDLVKAAEWYRVAAKQGYSDAQLKLRFLTSWKFL